MSLVLLSFVGGATSANAVGSYDNASIADIALTKLRQYGGQCKTFANNMVKQASGNTQWPAPGYHSGFANAGGVEVSSQNAAKGDIIQIGNSDYDYPLHTAIIVENKGGSNFNVVDSNWELNEIVMQHDINPYSWAPGSNIKIWRMGTVPPPPAPPAPVEKDKKDIAWWEGNTVFALVGPNFNTSSYSTGFEPGDWHGVMDYNDDGRDDVVLYRASDHTLRVLLKNLTGGYSGHPNNPVRTGLGVATWAGVGDFDGDGKKDDITWWEGDTVFTLVGPNFNTSSYSSGFIPGDWHGVMDYNKDGRDDVVLYRASDHTLRVLLKNLNGGYSGHPNNPVRTGLGVATWAGVGDFDGDGEKDDITWWEGDTVFTLVGPNFNTSSYSTGYIPGDWHGVMDYNNDGRDDIVLYRAADRTLRILLKNLNGGYSGHPNNPVRTGLGAPTWAGVSHYID